MFSILVRLSLVRLFLLAILLRLLLMPFYYHPDIKTYNFQSSFLKEGVSNIYTYLIEHNKELPIKEEFVYFPLTYLFWGSYQVIISPFLGNDFQSWVSDASAEAVNRVGTYRYLFLLKIPYLALDLMLPFLLINFFKSKKDKRDAFILWLFNPFSIFIIYIYSNTDIIPVVLSLASLLLFQKQRVILSGIFLGLAIGFKPYPVLFLPFLLLFLKDFKEFLKFTSFVMITILAILLPFFSKEFVNSALVSGLTTRIAYPNLNIGFGEALMVGVVSLSALFFTLFIMKNKQVEDSWHYLFLTLLLMFSSVHFHIQWLLWIAPFIVIYHIINRNNRKLIWIWLTLAFLIPLLYDDRSMTISLLSPISSLYKLLPTPFQILQKLYDPYLVQGILHSIIFGIAVVVSWISLRKFYE